MSLNRGTLGLLAALLLVSPALAGCLGTAQATAQEHKSTAEERASQWANNPRMIEIIGIEGTFAGAFGGFDAGHDADADYWERAREDPDKGDGHAELWVYRFIAEDQHDTVLGVVVDRDGEIIATVREPREADDEPIGEWNVDSDEAAETARDENEHLREGTSKDHYGFVMVLGEDEDYENPVWFIAGGGGDSSGGGGGFVVIDAVTGDVLASHGGSASGGDYGWDGSWENRYR